jgi:hypothetical protein
MSRHFRFLCVVVSSVVTTEYLETHVITLLYCEQVNLSVSASSINFMFSRFQLLFTGTKADGAARNEEYCAIS